MHPPPLLHCALLCECLTGRSQPDSCSSDEQLSKRRGGKFCDAHQHPWQHGSASVHAPSGGNIEDSFGIRRGAVEMVVEGQGGVVDPLSMNRKL